MVYGIRNVNWNISQSCLPLISTWHYDTIWFTDTLNWSFSYAVKKKKCILPNWHFCTIPAILLTLVCIVKASTRQYSVKRGRAKAATSLCQREALTFSNPHNYSLKRGEKSTAEQWRPNGGHAFKCQTEEKRVSILLEWWQPSVGDTEMNRITWQ